VRTILCVDDHPAALQAISLLLESRGYRCVTASNPEEALRLLAENAIDLAVVDHWLTETTGTALAVQMKAIRNVPIIMFTGDPDLKDAPEPVDLLLGKPQVPEDLLAFVAALLPDDREQSAKKFANGL
jgi:two-component system torCAD operon response regulator TorR